MAYSSIVKPTDYFVTKLYTGNGGTNNITGLDFAPNLVWIKRRTSSNHKWTDSVRGATKVIESDNDALESTDSNGLTAFNSDGFTLGSSASFNSNTVGFASWNWKAGTSVSGTTTGSGTGKAYTGSVNTDAGFSIIRHLGNDTAGHTIPHHLGAVPKMIIGHGLTGSDTTSWTVYHHALSNTHTVSLNETAASVSSTVWNNTTPTSSVISLGSSGNVNDNDDAFILYSFAEKKGYSKFGSYTGNGNADGPFIYTGFKPAFLIFKSSSSTQNWHVIDNKRDTHNPVDLFMWPNLVDGDYAETQGVDFLSNGFKIKESGTFANGSGDTYIYMAFAENPFVANDSGTAVPVVAR